MKIQIYNSYKNALTAKGLVIVIDVLRAFTTACYVIERGAKNLIAVEDEQIAVGLKRANPEYVLIGERKGLRISAADYNNSPWEVSLGDFVNRTVILTTTSGTKVIPNLLAADEVITGAFVNIHAVASYVLKLNPKVVSILCTDNRYENNEDYECAVYIKRLLEGKKENFEKIKTRLRSHPSAYGFIKKPLTTYGPKDFRLCLQINKFDFILRVRKVGKQLYLEPIKAPTYVS